MTGMRIISRHLPTRSLIFLLIWAIPAAGTPQELADGPSAIRPSELERHLQFLGNDDLEGRGAGSRGEKLAASYISRELARNRILPAGDGGTYLQAVPMHGSTPLPDSECRLITPDDTLDLALWSQYVLIKSGAQTFVPNPVPLVFVGYGIVAPEFDYNDYQALDVEDKIVVFLPGEPRSDDPAYFSGEDPTVYSYPESKVRMAISRGARGSILLPGENGKEWDEWTRQYAFEDVNLAYTITGHLSLVVDPQSAALLFAGAAHDLERIYQMERQSHLHSCPLRTSLSFKGKFRERDFLGHNVLGCLEGADPELKKSCLILSAHYDHLGIGPPVRGDSIYNGVFDNAAGVAALLEIAAALSRLDPPPARSVLFIFLTGEEKGLLGSTYYLDHPAFPLYRTIANINVDGLAMFDTFNDAVGIGAEYSTLGETLSEVSAELGLAVSPIPSPSCTQRRLRGRTRSLLPRRAFPPCSSWRD